MEKSIASIYELWARQEVPRAHWGIILFLISWDTLCSHQPLKLVRDFFPHILFIFRERGQEGESEGETHQCVKHQLVAPCMLPTGHLARNPGMCHDWELKG